MRLRKATTEDARMLWEWANDAEVRQMSIFSGAIPWDDHLDWYDAKLSAPEASLYIAISEDGHPIGLIRFDIDADKANVSINTAPEHRGKGFGPRIIVLGVSRVAEEFPVPHFEAVIKAQNTKSLRAFEKAGFADTGAVTVEGLQCRIFTLRLEADYRGSLADHYSRVVAEHSG